MRAMFLSFLIALVLGIIATPYCGGKENLKKAKMACCGTPGDVILRGLLLPFWFAFQLKPPALLLYPVVHYYEPLNVGQVAKDGLCVPAL